MVVEGGLQHVERRVQIVLRADEVLISSALVIIATTAVGMVRSIATADRQVLLLIRLLAAAVVIAVRSALGRGSRAMQLTPTSSTPSSTVAGSSIRCGWSWSESAT